MGGRPAIFLDRDGVLIEEVNYLSEVGQVRLTRGAGPAVARLNRAGLPVVVVTNQAGVARGFFDEQRVREVHNYLNELLARDGASVDAYYYCPHHPTKGQGDYKVACSCRKPEPGMLLRAALEWSIDLEKSFLVGDKVCDLQAGARVSCRTLLVRTGYGASISDEELRREDYRLLGRVENLAEAVEVCLAQAARVG
jgi:D-glycero-D-manno-heptose 1,7-bisphosphate phosphatase